jgi:glutathione synthase/RimK-type ligase-like ATP-grasp enzyme
MAVKRRVALVSQHDLPTWEVDDRPFEEALRASGVEVSKPAWDDPAVDWTCFDAALLRTTWDYADRVADFVAWARAAERRTLLLHDASIVAWNTDKTYLRQLAECGVPTAPCVWLERGANVQIAEIMAARGWARGFLKPVFGQTARETLRFSWDAEGLVLAAAHLDRLLPVEGMILQPYLASVEQLGEVSVILIDEQVSHAVRKVPVPGDYRVQDDFGARDERIACPAELEALAAQAVQAARRCLGRDQPLLYARVDALQDDEGRLVLNELEIVEPSLFFRHAPEAGERLAEALLRRVGNPVTGRGVGGA